MATKDSLGDRMKEYESVSKNRLMKRTPVIIRIDGKSFHVFARGFAKPFDDVLIKTMQETTKYLCEHIQGCVMGYTQSDEITLVLEDYHDINVGTWFDYEVQKMCSIAASMATMVFNKEFERVSTLWWMTHSPNANVTQEEYEKICKQYETYEKAISKGAMFDARCFNVPKDDVTNCVLWRQQDATRNSIQMVAQANFSHKELQGKSCNMLQDMLHEQRGINWNDFPVHKKRGTAVVKVDGKWVIDTEMPILTGEGRDYIESRINFE